MAECSYCGKKYDSQKEAEECFKGHEIVYVPIAKADLNGLVHFLYTPDEKFLNPVMVKILKSYLAKAAVKK